MISTDMPFEFKGFQFPVQLAFAKTTNKVQEQSLQVCGLNLENPCFTHGQLNVTCSCVRKPYIYSCVYQTEKQKKYLSKSTLI